MATRVALGAFLLATIGCACIDAQAIHCGCSLGELRECESWGAQPICELSFFTIGGAQSDLDSVRTVRWFETEVFTVPHTTAVPSRSLRPWAMNPGDGSVPAFINCSALRRTPQDPPGYKFVSARITKTDGGIAEIKAKFAFQVGLATPPSPPGGGGGIPRTLPPTCPASPGPGGPAPLCMYSGTSIWNPPTSISFSAFATRVAQQCANSVLIIGTPLSFADLTSSAPLRILRNRITLSATAGVTLSFAAEEGQCGVLVYGSRATIVNFAIAGKAGLCICSTAAALPGVSIVRFNSEASFGGVRVDPGAQVLQIVNYTCSGLEDACIVNRGYIGSIADSIFSGGAKDGGILNVGVIDRIVTVQFLNMNAGGGVDCPAASGVVVNAGGASIGSITRCVFEGAIDGRAIWNDGVLGSGNMGIGLCSFSNLIGRGAIANGPTGMIARIYNNTFESLSAETGPGILNHGVISGRVEYNRFVDTTSSDRGGVIANMPAPEFLCSSVPVAAGSATIGIGIMDNTMLNFLAGDGCGGIYNAEGAVIGDYDSAWAAITSESYAPSAMRSTWTGIVRNTLNSGSSSDSGGGICNWGKLSMLYRNTIASTQTGDSGGALENLGLAAYVGNNVVSGITVGDIGGGILCGRLSFEEGAARAAIRMIKGNSISNVQSSGPGGCMFASVACGVQYLVSNQCNNIISPPIVFEVIPPQPDAPGQSATLCTSVSNLFNGALLLVAPTVSGTCPVTSNGLW